jgi:hypothetical protein
MQVLFQHHPLHHGDLRYLRWSVCKLCHIGLSVRRRGLWCGRQYAGRCGRLLRSAAVFRPLNVSDEPPEFIPPSHQYLLTFLAIWWCIGQLIASLVRLLRVHEIFVHDGIRLLGHSSRTSRVLSPPVLNARDRRTWAGVTCCSRSAGSPLFSG